MDLDNYNLDLLKQKPFKLLLDVWTEARIETQKIPNRQSLSIHKIVSLVPNFVVFEYENDEFYVRLQGQEMTDRIDKNMKDQSVASLMVPSLRDEANQILKSLLTEVKGCVMLFDTEYTSGKHSLVSSLFIPINNNDGELKCLVGVYNPLETLDFGKKTHLTQSGSKVFKALYFDLPTP